MRPALTRAFNDNPNDDRLNQVFGRRPRLVIAALILGTAALGMVVRYGVGEFPGRTLLNWPAVFSGLVFAIALRRYLFGDGQASDRDFPWLAGVLIPAAAVPVLIAIIAELVVNVPQPLDGGPGFTVVGDIALLLVSSLGVAAAFTIAVAALCYSRNWVKAFMDLAGQLFVFKLMVWLTLFVLVEIGIVGPIIAAVVESTFGIQVPGWIGDFADQLTTVAVLTAVYLAIIGATWTVCRQHFGALLETGDVRVLHEIEQLTRGPKKEKKKKKKKTKKRRWGRKREETP